MGVSAGIRTMYCVKGFSRPTTQARTTIQMCSESVHTAMQLARLCVAYEVPKFFYINWLGLLGILHCLAWRSKQSCWLFFCVQYVRLLTNGVYMFKYVSLLANNACQVRVESCRHFSAVGQVVCCLAIDWLGRWSYHVWVVCMCCLRCRCICVSSLLSGVTLARLRTCSLCWPNNRRMTHT